MVGNLVLTELIERRYRSGHLDLSGSDIDDENAKEIVQDTTLVILGLAWNRIGDEGAVALANTGSFSTLTLAGNYVGDLGARAFAENSTITSLIISHNRIGDDGAEALAKNKTITTLAIGNNNIRDRGLVALYEWTNIRAEKGNPVVIEGIDLSKARIEAARENLVRARLGKRGPGTVNQGR
ncbi:MAG: hypothetical protein QOE70_201 [Chthoniobacter sp.]|jgi:hypothetical protein|nr:hypothetical protein [Chthoniobacter sp.]